MRLTLHADYGLRVLVYLGTHEGRVVTTTEVSQAYGISKNHLVRVAQSLRDAGYVALHPGRLGGLSLAKAAKEIRVGAVVRALEPDMHIVECFDRATNTCPIAPGCALKSALREASEAFLASLDRLTIADVLADSRGNLKELFFPVSGLLQKATARPK